MSYWLVAAAIVLLGLGFIHSYLGERYIIRRLMRRDNIPHLFGSDWFTKRTIRFAWHLTTVAWTGLALVLVLLAAHFGDASEEAVLTSGRDTLEIVGYTISGILLVSAAVTAAASRGRHLAWIAFLAAGAFTIVGI